MALRRVLAWLWPIVALLVGVGVAWALLSTAPKTAPEDKQRPARIVQTLNVAPENISIQVSAHGEVVPAQNVVIRPEVRGRVLWQNKDLVLGGVIAAGEELIRIDPADYELALTEQEAALEDAKLELALEKGRQVVASREWSLLESELNEGEVNRSLVLREPHLRRIEAMVRKATNEIAKAKLALFRTRVDSPFNAMVLTESVELGQLVEPGTVICTLVGTDEFWVQAAVSLDNLKSLRLPSAGQEGPPATVVVDAGNGSLITWEGKVVRLLGDLDPNGRMARLLVRVTDPLSLSAVDPKEPLLLGTYVRVDIDAGTLSNVLEIPLTAIREGGRVWIVNAQQELEVRPAEVLWTRGDSVLIANCLNPGDQLVLGGVRVALPGMKVQAQPVGEPDDRS